MRATKNPDDYQSDGSYLLTTAFDSNPISGEMVEGSLFTFSADDATNRVFAQLALAYRQQKSVVVSIDADGKDIDYIDSSKTQLLLNEDGTFSIYNPDFEKLALGEVADVSIRFLQSPAANSGSTLIVNTTALKVTGTNEAPLVEEALASTTNEDTSSYVIDLLQGASDIDHGAVLAAVNVVETSSNARGWSLEGDTLVVDPSAYGYLNDGQSQQLLFEYEVTDEHGATVMQSLSIAIEGITDPPTVEVRTSAGNDVNEVILHVTSTQAAKEQVRLAFQDLPEGARVYDGETDVTGGIADFFSNGYDGTHDFKVVFNGGVDLDTAIQVQVTGIHPAHGDYPYKELPNSQSIELHFDVNDTPQQQVTFSNSNLNMWGDTGTPVIEWHEYLPVLGNDFMQWREGEWQIADAGLQRWSSGTVTLADVSFATSDITDEALAGLKFTRDTALETLATAREVYAEIKDIVPLVTNYNWAKTVTDTWNSFSNQLKTLTNSKTAAFDALYYPVWNLAWAYYSVWPNKIDNEDDRAGASANAAFGIVNELLGLGGDLLKIFDPTGLIRLGWSELTKGLSSAIDAVDNLVNSDLFQDAKLDFNSLTKSATSLLSEFTNLVAVIPNDLAAKIGVSVPKLPNADEWSTFIQSLESKLDATIENSFAALADLAQDAYNTAASAINSVDFSTQLKMDAEISGYAGVLVDFRLDGGSVDTDVKYVFSSRTQYNQTTDMLAITPTLVNVVDGDEVAFSTASPNVSITAKLLYDVEAALDVYLNGKLAVGDLGFDLGDGIHFAPVFTTSGSNMQFQILDSSRPILDENGFHLENLRVTMSDEIIPYNEMFVGLETDRIGTPGEVTLFDFSSSTGDLAVPFYSTNIGEIASEELSSLISGLTEGMIEKIELALPSIETSGQFVSEDALLAEHLSSPEYVWNKLFDPGYDPAGQSFGQNINDYYYDETFKTINLDQVTSIFENATISLGKEIEALLDLDYLQAHGYTNLANYLDGADIGAIIRDVSLNFAQNAFDLFKETLDGKYTTDSFVIVDMTQGESDALFHINSLSFNSDDLISDPTNPESWTNPLLPYQDADITEDTASFGLYVAGGESDPMYRITLDVDEVVAFVLRKVIQTATGIPLPDSASPFKMGVSLDDMLSIAEVDQATRDTVKQYIDVGMTVDKMDYDVTSAIDFSQDFTLTVDDMSYLLTFTEGENPVNFGFKASEAEKIVIANASQYDGNQDGTIEYDLQIVPTAMFSNDTELGYTYGLSLDFLTTALQATFGLPLGTMLGISGVPDLSYQLLDYNIGPVLDIDAAINGLDIDVYESRFGMDIGEVTLADNGIAIDLTGLPTQEITQPLLA